MKRIFLAFIALLSVALAFGQGVTILPKTTVLPNTTIFPGTAAAGGPAFVGSAGNGTTASCTDSTTSCPVTYSPTAGNYLYIALTYPAAHVITSVTDNGATGGCTYTQVYTAVAVNTSQQFLTAYQCLVAKSATTTITANGGGESVIVLEFSNMTGTPAVDVSNLTPNITSATTFISGNITTTNAKDVVFGQHFDVGTAQPTWGNTGGYTTVGNNNAFVGTGNAVTYTILSSTAMTAATGTVGGADGIYNIVTSVKQ